MQLKYISRCLFAAACYLMITLTWSRSTSTLHYVPVNANPGHIVTKLSRDTQQPVTSRIHPSANDATVANYFSVLQHGSVITVGNVTSLEGQTISLTILHEAPGQEPWMEQLSLQVTSQIPKPLFTNSPFSGYIFENKPSGSEIKGLSKLADDFAQFPFGCILRIDDGDRQFFDINTNPASKRISIVSTVEFNYEVLRSFEIILKATCAERIESYANVSIAVHDVNDETPVFEQAVYEWNIDLARIIPETAFLQTHANDADSKDLLRYSISPDMDGLFQMDPSTGRVHVTDSSALTQLEYNFKVYVIDAAGHEGIPARVNAQLYNSDEEIEIEKGPNKVRNVQDCSDEAIFNFEDQVEYISTNAVRHKRQADLDMRSYVVVNTGEAMQTEDIFSVASIPLVEEERYAFAEPAPEGLSLDEMTGLVTREVGHMWESEVEMFDVIISRSDDATYNDTLPVNVYVVDRPWQDPVLTSMPVPLKYRVPVWIRPDVSIATLQSLDADISDCEVMYKLETGGEGRFYVEQSTGEIRIADRAMFESDPDPNAEPEYELGISAQCVGQEAALSRNTPAQSVMVEIDDVRPQFYYSPYVIDVPETTALDTVVTSIMVKSFFNLDIDFAVTWDSGDDGYFTINGNTGQVTLIQEMEYITAYKTQFRATVVATEENSDLTSTEEVIINLVPENLHTPTFPPTHYVAIDINENVPVGTSILELFAVDLDPGELGLMNFTTDNDLFIVESSDFKEGTLVSNGALDYDFIGPEHKYEFMVYATDMDPDNPRTGSVTVQVFMENDPSDEPPVLTPESPRIYLKEGASDGTLIHVIQGFDPDGGTVSYSFVSSPDFCQTPSSATECDIFNLDQDTGQLTLNADVSNSNTNGVLRIELDDGSGTNGIVEKDIDVEFVGVNHPPKFTECGTYEAIAIIEEDKPVFTTILNVTVEDEDSGSNGEVVLSVVPDVQGTYFGINQTAPKEGVLYSLESFDREDRLTGAAIIGGDVKYKVNIQAQDLGRPPLSTTCFFFVTIQDINNNDPIFDETIRYSVTIRRDTTQSTEIVRVFAVDDDKDENGRVTYSLTNSDDCVDCFAVDEDSGWIRIASAIPSNLNEITVTATATDNGANQRSRDIPVVITLTNDDEALPPVWDRINGERIDDYEDLQVDENIGRGFMIAEFNATLAAGSQGINYFLVPGRSRLENGERDFIGAEGDTGLIVSVNEDNLPFEEVPEYTLKMRASRRVTGSPPYTDARLRVKVNDVNDQVPTWEGLNSLGVYSTAVSDQTVVGETIINVQAIDLDGTAPNNVVTYFWDDNCGDPCNAFNIDEDTGTITAAQEYDREVVAAYFLRVVAEDGAPSAIREDGLPNRATPQQVAITVLSPSLNPPQFPLTEYTLTTPEGQPLYATVGNVTAIDEDVEFNYPQYMISNIQDSTSRMPFSVDPTNGTIYVTGDIVFEELESYTLTYRVFDGSGSDETSVMIEIQMRNVNPPMFDIVVYEVPEGTVVEHDSSITENNPRELLQVTATDPNPFTYSIEGVNSEYFSVDEDGFVSLLQALDRDYPVGYENWQINVVATNQHPDGTSRAGYSILNLRMDDINDNPPRWDFSTIEGSVMENGNSDVVVMTIVAGDVDEGNNGQVSYVLYVSPQDDIGDDLFSLESATGVISTQATFDREEQDHYELIVGAFDGGSPSLSAEYNQTIYITIDDENDNIPFFTENTYEFEMPEEIPIGGFVMDMTATDDDLGDNAKLTFSISDADVDDFYFDSIYVTKTGALKIQQPVDYDTMSPPFLISFGIRVDDPDFSDTANVIITVTDINDNAPVFVPPSANESFPENADVGFIIATFIATDIDSEENGEFDYMIDHENTDPERKFDLDPAQLPGQAVVIINDPVDREIVAGYELHILAVDRGEPAMTGTATLYITLEDINDHAPDFEDGSEELVVSATASLNEVVGRVYGTDLDTIINGPPFTFEWQCNAPECSDFTFETETDTDGSSIGVVRANRDDGYSRTELGRKFYTIPINMRDNPTSGQASLDATRELIITIESTNENQMAPGVKGVVVYTYKGMYDNVPLGNVYVEDPDDWDLPDKEFECVAGCVSDGFTFFLVNATSGQVTMKAGAPFGMNRLEVEVTDRSWPQTVTSVVNVQVIYFFDEFALRSGSVRLSGITAEDFIERDETEVGMFDKAEAELFRDTMAELLGTEPENVEVLAIVNVPDEDMMIDVTFAAHGSPYYSAARLNGVVMANTDRIESDIPVTVEMSPVNLCLEETCFGVPCYTNRTVVLEPALVNTNQTSYVGTNVEYEAVCADFSLVPATQPIECEELSCLNDGVCVPSHHGWTCNCTEGFEGPRCQQTKITFESNGWGYFDTLDQFVSGRISFAFATADNNGVLLYNGPSFSNNGPGNVADFIAIYLEDGFAAARIDLGGGEVALKVDQGDRINDNEWHVIEIIKQEQLLRLVVDNCRDAIVNENINDTEEIRTSCEDAQEAQGRYYLLNVLTPLQLGGRQDPTEGPSGLPNNNNFNGCLKDLRVNDKLYDLNVEITESSGLINGCAAESCFADGVSLCPLNSTCVGSLVSGAAYSCSCTLGRMGDMCDEPTTVIDFETDPSFAQWTLLPAFNSTSPLNNYNLRIAVTFKTRTEDGIIFSAASFSRLEHIKVDMVESHPRLRYDLGAGEYDLTMDQVNASDGVLHRVYVERHGNHLWFMMDQCEGVLFKESLPIEEHRLMYLANQDQTDQTYAGAEVYYMKYHDDPDVTEVLVASCVSDIRIDDERLPLNAEESAANDIANLARELNTVDTCSSDACVPNPCPSPFLCVDVWRMPLCVCPAGQQIVDGICVDIVDCSIPRCNGNGYCVVPDGQWYCHCFEGWTGLDCSEETGTGGQTGDNATLATGAIAAIIIAILVLLILILLVLCFIMRRTDNDPLLVDPNDETRENIVYYDEEGAGEEDMHAYDLSRLQKPVDGMGGMNGEMVNPAFASPIREDLQPLTSGATAYRASMHTQGGAYGADGGVDSIELAALQATSANAYQAGQSQRGGSSSSYGAAANGEAELMAHAQNGASGMGGRTTETTTTTTKHYHIGGLAPEPMSAPRGKYAPGDHPPVGDFIGDRLKDADHDPNLGPYDSVREYEYEGGGSSAGSLSSLQTSSSGDLDFSYLNDFGPRFQKLADLYGVGQDDDDGSSV